MKLNRKNLKLNSELPIRVVQFGEGNFLRAFVDIAFQKLNNTAHFNAGIAVVQPIDRGLIDVLNEQEGLYTLFLKGIKDGNIIREKHLISSIVKGINPYTDFANYMELAQEDALEFIISNTTEAGIAFDKNDTPEMQPPGSFPAKLTLFLFERFKFYSGNERKGLKIIPCELINYNADTLRDIILKYIDKWELGSEFEDWVVNHNSFHNTLVDRIVPGYPKDNIEEYKTELLYEDNLIVTAENFFLWVIEGDQDLEKRLPFDATGLDVKIVEDMQPFRTRKVRILNGSHTAMVPFSILYGNETVKETVDDLFTGQFIYEAVFEEIIPTLKMEKTELEKFAHDVFDRFRNPFIRHLLSSIALNSVSKFKVRVLPSLLAYVNKEGKLPLRLVFAFACLIRFYKGEWDGKQLPVNDGEEELSFFRNAWSLSTNEKTATSILSNVQFWDTDLTKVPGLKDAVVLALSEIEGNGIENGWQGYLSKLKQ